MKDKLELLTEKYKLNNYKNINEYIQNFEEYKIEYYKILEEENLQNKLKTEDKIKFEELKKKYEEYIKKFYDKLEKIEDLDKDILEEFKIEFDKFMLLELTKKNLLIIKLFKLIKFILTSKLFKSI